MTEPRLRYGQCWEDPHCLLQALAPRPGARLLSIASGGENSLALLSCAGVQVLAIDRSAAQIAALELKVAAFRRLSHADMLRLLGAHPTTRAQRRALYQRCRGDLAPPSRAFWDGDSTWLGCGVLAVARFERYLALFRRLVLPLVQGGPRCRQALLPRSPAERRQWYDSHWDHRRWRWLFALFFNRTSLGSLGTAPECVRYGDDSQADQLLAQLRRVMVEADPSRNPYLHWLLQGRYGEVLPLALRPQLFATIRSRLERLRWQTISLEDWLQQAPDHPVDGFNLSNVLEYVDAAGAGTLLDGLHRRAAPGARLVLWNRLAQRSTALATPGCWQPLEALAQQLHQGSAVPFYRRLVVAEALPSPADMDAPAPARAGTGHPAAQLLASEACATGHGGSHAPAGPQGVGRPEAPHSGANRSVDSPAGEGRLLRVGSCGGASAPEPWRGSPGP